MVDIVGALAASGAAILLGQLVLKGVPVFARLNLPTPVIGGIIISIALAVVTIQSNHQVRFDQTLQTPLMVCFFATLGFGASINTILKGGKSVALFLVGATIVLIAQNLLGIAISYWIGQPLALGVLTGSTALAGGPGTVLAFAPQFVERGIPEAEELGLAAAMMGIILGGTLGAPLGTLLIRGLSQNKSSQHLDTTSTTKEQPQLVDPQKFVSRLSDHLIVILLVMWIGTQLSKLISDLGVTVPVYIGAMIIAAIVRNVADYTSWTRIEETWINSIGSVALSLFLALSLINLQLSEIGKVAGPLAILIGAQLVLVMLTAKFVFFKIFGKDYDAALISAGFVGFMLGTTANAMANLEALRARYGPAPRAFLVVPLVGAGFIDFINALVIAFLINLSWLS